MLQFELSEQTVQTIINALGEFRFRDAAPALQELQRQINMQRPQHPGNGKAEQPQA